VFLIGTDQLPFNYFTLEKTMAQITEQLVLGALRNVREPELHKDLVTLNMIRDLKIKGDDLAFTIVLTTPACPLTAQIEKNCRDVLAQIGAQNVAIDWKSEVPADQRIRDQLAVSFHNTIAVSSGKGGVGKSTVAANMAVALAKMGAGVGLLDADIYGPNIPLMMGVDRLPRAAGEKITPALAYGVRLMSMAFVVDPDQPIIWRGPMIHSAIRQFLTEVDWGQLDYLIIDLPPGTGDAQLTLAQSVPLTGAVIVTTPQEVALADALKGLRMFEKLEVPILGIVENMGPYVDAKTGQKIAFFGEGGGERMSQRLQVPYLGSVPLDLNVREGGDAGKPIVSSQPDSLAATALNQIARQVAARISVINLEE
jgi:ATP-binding protein involved in chromosome partitioning